MYRTYIIIDDFLDQPEVLRNPALKLSYPSLGFETNFPGRNASQAVVVPELEVVISKIVGEKLKPKTGTSHGKFRLTLAGDKGAAGVHLDDCAWSGILYLTPDEFCQGGTHFYRHKATNMDRAPITVEELQALGMSSMQEVWDNIVDKDTNNPEKWEHLMTVPMKYNRLVLFRPWLFHNAGQGFGDNVENGRLIYPLFFENDI